MRKPTGSIITGLILVLALPTTADTASLIQSLQAQIQALQTQLSQLQAQEGAASITALMPEFSLTLRRGSRGDEVKRLQEFLAKYQDIYPEAVSSGYFGTLTEAAVKRFQVKYGLPSVGIVGPQTRAKLNELLKPVPPPPAPLPAPAPLPVPAPAPAATTTQPTPPPPAPAPSPAPTPASINLPTQAQLGLPLISFFGWGQNYLKISFSHDPDVYTRSYAIYLKYPNQSTETKLGPYVIPSAIGTSTIAADGSVFTRTGQNSWQWKQTLDLASQPEGVYSLGIAAVGDGGVESARSPGWLTTLYGPPPFDDLLQGSNNDVVKNLTVTDLPLTIRLKDPIADLYYEYSIYDGTNKIWTGGNITKSTKAGVQVSFSNPNNYALKYGASYRIRVDEYNNDSHQDSRIKQKPNEITFTYARTASY